MDVLGLDHVELFVADPDDPISVGVRTLGLVPSGLDRRSAGTTSRSYRCGSTSLVLTTPSGSWDAAGTVGEFLHRHGSGVANIGLRTTDAAGSWRDAVAGGAEPVGPPVRHAGRGEVATTATVRAFGDVSLTLVERSDPAPARPFGFVEVPTDGGPGAGRPDFGGIDHLAVCLPPGELDAAAAYYTDVLGFVRSFEERVAVGGQAMDSIVVQDGRGALVLTLLCQDADLKPGQISRFVDANGGAGVQHVAFLTRDVLRAVELLRGSVDFLAIPPSYYEHLRDQPGVDPADVARLEEAGVLRDRDPWGTILQTFTRSGHPRETLFFELVERRGARTFGSGNIRALYEAVGRVEPVDTSVHPDDQGPVAPR